MTIDYKRALSELRRPIDELNEPYSKRLFSNSWDYTDYLNFNEKVSKVSTRPLTEKLVNKKTQSEKTPSETLAESKQLKGKKEEALVLSGGQVNETADSISSEQTKDEPIWSTKSLRTEELKSYVTSLSQDLYAEKFEKENEKLDLLFIVDEILSSNKKPDELKASEFQDSPVTKTKADLFFKSEVSTLFQKMIGAMKLSSKNYSISLFDPENSHYLFYEICLRRPSYLVGLGGYTSSALLKSKDRLQQLRGRFHKVNIKYNKQVEVFELLPLFSPNYLNEAPNSKRLAWTDMQMLMSKLQSSLDKKV